MSIKGRIRDLIKLLNFEYLKGILKGWLAGREKLISFSVLGRKMKMRYPLFKAQYRSIFLYEEYILPLNISAPRILDLGANVGMSCLYFKILFPDSYIDAFEADPEIGTLLAENLATNGIKGVELHYTAAWIRDEDIKFVPNGLDGGAINVDSFAGKNEITMRAIDLKKWLDGKKFDIIKIDIEGAENELIPHIFDSIQTANHVVLEYHSIKQSSQRLGDILRLFENGGFRCYLKAADSLRNPFINELAGHFDNRIVIYCSKVATF